MKSARPLFAALALFSLSCVSGASSPASSSPSTPANASPSSGGAGCAGQKIRTKADLSNCTDACRDQQRTQAQGCSDPACQQGVGAATNACFAKCDEAKKSSKAANCYTE
jgi:Spy/CpxP family protein refolding chaperone